MSKALRKRRKAEKALRTIHKLAEKNNLDPSTVAYQIVENRRPEVEQYVQRFGEDPKPNTAALAAQAAMIHENRIIEKQENGVPDYDVAEDAVHMDDVVGEEMGEHDEFAPALLAAVFSAGKKAIEAINAKRESKGKKPLFAGKGFKNLTNKVQEIVKVDTSGDSVNVSVTPKAVAEKTDAQKSDVAIVAGKMKDEIKKAETKAWVQDNFLYIAGGVALIYFIGKKS